MGLKKQCLAGDEIAIFDNARVYKRGKHWQFHMSLPKENKHEFNNLIRRSKGTAIEKDKALLSLIHHLKDYQHEISC